MIYIDKKYKVTFGSFDTGSDPLDPEGSHLTSLANWVRIEASSEAGRSFFLSEEKKEHKKTVFRFTFTLFLP